MEANRENRAALLGAIFLCLVGTVRSEDLLEEHPVLGQADLFRLRGNEKRLVLLSSRGRSLRVHVRDLDTEQRTFGKSSLIFKSPKDPEEFCVDVDAIVPESGDIYVLAYFSLLEDTEPIERVAFITLDEKGKRRGEWFNLSAENGFRAQRLLPGVIDLGRGGHLLHSFGETHTNTYGLVRGQLKDGKYAILSELKSQGDLFMSAMLSGSVVGSSPKNAKILFTDKDQYHWCGFGKFKARPASPEIPGLNNLRLRPLQLTTKKGLTHLLAPLRRGEGDEDGFKLWYAVTRPGAPIRLRTELEFDFPYQDRFTLVEAPDKTAYLFGCVENEKLSGQLPYQLAYWILDPRKPPRLEKTPWLTLDYRNLSVVFTGEKTAQVVWGEKDILMRELTIVDAKKKSPRKK